MIKTHIWNFFKPPKTLLIHKIIHFLSILVMILGVIAYLYLCYEVVNWTLKFPFGNRLHLPMLLMLISILFVSAWMPFAMVLIRWNRQKILIAIIYITGCVIGLILSISSTILIDDYEKPGQMKEEFVRIISENVMKSESSFPWQVLYTIDSDECCGWIGPIDFGPPEIIDLSSKIDDDLKFMTDVTKCYGNAFTVERGQDGKLNYKRNPGKKITGCGLMYKQLLRRICYFIAYGGIIVDALSIIFIVLYIFNCCGSRKKRVVPIGEEEEGVLENAPVVTTNSPPAPRPAPIPGGGNYVRVLPSLPSDFTLQQARRKSNQPRRSMNAEYQKRISNS